MASGNILWEFGPYSNEPPSSNYALFDTQNGRPVLVFDPAADWASIFTGVLSDKYAGGGLTIELVFQMASATSGNVVLGTSIERNQDGTDTIASDSFASENTSTVAVPGSLVEKYTTIAHTSGAQMDSLAVGEMFRLKVRRIGSNGSDTAAGNLYFVRGYIKET